MFSLRFEKIILLFFASVVMGSGIGYSSLYLFHIVLVLLFSTWVYCSFNGLNVYLYKPKTPSFYFLVFMFIWYAISIIWSIEPVYTIRYLFYLLMGLSIVFLTVSYVVNEYKYEKVFSVLKLFFVIEIIIAWLEIYTPFRLPTSPYSEYANAFARKATLFYKFDSEIVETIKSTPTAFFGNPNNLSVVIVSLLPFFLFSKSWLVKVLGSLSVFVIIIGAGSRAAFLAFILGLLLYFLIRSQFHRFVMMFVFLLSAVIVSVNIDNLKASENVKIAEIAHTGDAIIAYLFAPDNESKGSISIRRQLVSNGINALTETYGLGVGGGGSLAVQERLGGVNGKITSMHNFWVEILVDAGMLFFVAFVVWYFILSYKLYTIYKRENRWFYRYHAGSLFLSFMIFSVACIGASTVIYILPMWLMFGMSIALISIHKMEDIQNGSRKVCI